MSKSDNKIKPVIYLVVLVALLASLLVLGIRKSDSPKTESVSTAPAAEVVVDMSTEDQLLYLIEEEKLAFDVYTAMYQKYDARVFGNILKSEATHQERVLALLQSRNLSDPRSTEAGVFNNSELQSLYDQLIERGNKSLQDAHAVGVTIEEMDIADLSDQLKTTSDQEVATTLEALLASSESHLAAFSRQRS